jgi:transketolase
VDGFDVVDHRVIAECGDGDLMEGVSAEASSLAGHLGLGKLTLLYDDDQVTLDGPARWAFTEDVATRYLAYGWHVVRLEEVDDLAAIDLAIADADAETERPGAARWPSGPAPAGTGRTGSPGAAARPGPRRRLRAASPRTESSARSPPPSSALPTTCAPRCGCQQS